MRYTENNSTTYLGPPVVYCSVLEKLPFESSIDHWDDIAITSRKWPIIGQLLKNGKLVQDKIYIPRDTYQLCQIGDIIRCINNDN